MPSPSVKPETVIVLLDPTLCDSRNVVFPEIVRVCPPTVLLKVVMLPASTAFVPS